MLNTDLHTLLRIALTVAGGFAFIHLVANEKHRREKWLAFRLQEKLKEARHDGPETPNP